MRGPHVAGSKNLNTQRHKSVRCSDFSFEGHVDCHFSLLFFTSFEGTVMVSLDHRYVSKVKTVLLHFIASVYPK